MNYRKAYQQNLTLAAPIVASQAGQMLVSMADTIMVAQVGKTELAAIAFVNAIYVTFLVAVFGFAMGLTTYVGQANGVGDMTKARILLFNSLIVNFIFSTTVSLMMIAAVPFLDKMGQDESVTQISYGYYYLMVASIVPFGLFVSFKFYVDGIQKPGIGMLHTLLPNALNILLNYLFIFGKFGMPAMGLLGAGLATLIARVLQALGIAAHVLWMHKGVKVQSWLKLHYPSIRALFWIGIPIALQLTYEVLAFSLGAVMMGNIGKDELAAHQIVITVAGLTYLMASGIGGAATISNSNELGKLNYQHINIHSRASWHLVLMFMGLTGMLFISLRHWLPSLFISDARVEQIASTLFVFAGLFQIFDGMQAVGQGVLRGIADVKVPSLLAFIAYFVVLLPVSYIFAFEFQYGAVGIWIGYLVGLATATVLLLLRFRFVMSVLRKGTLKS